MDTDVLQRANSGIYPAAALESLDERTRRSSFLGGRGAWEGCMRVRPELRSMVQFRQINLVEKAWPVRTRFDAIFCRNVMIYFDQQTQRDILERMSVLLNSDGLLFVGHSENLYWLRNLFTPVIHAVYRLNHQSSPARPA